MNVKAPIRILEWTATASSRVAKWRWNPKLQKRPVWVGGEAAQQRHRDRGQPGSPKNSVSRPAWRVSRRRGSARCGVLCRPHYDEYRRLSEEMFRILEEYSPRSVPISIDEGFSISPRWTGMSGGTPRRKSYVKRNRRTDPARGEMAARVRRAGQSSRLAKLATDAANRVSSKFPSGHGKGNTQGPPRARTFRHRQKPATRAGRPRRGDFRGRAELPSHVAPAKIRDFRASNSGYSPTAAGTSRSCSKSRTAPGFPATPRCPTTSRITRRR